MTETTTPSHIIPASLGTSLRVWWAALPSFQRILLGLIGLRLLIALIFLLNILPLDLREGWYLHHGGDQDIMFQMAKLAVRGESEPDLVGFGQPFVMMPFILLTDARAYYQIVTPLVIINGFILGGLSVLLVGQIVRAATGEDRVALWSAGLWAAIPLIAYVSFFWHYDPVILFSSNVPKLGWLNGLSDGPAMFYMMLAIFIMAHYLNRKDKPSDLALIVFGIVGGIAIMVRVHMLPAVAFLMLYALIGYRWRALALAVGGMLLGYLPQAWYNQRVFGFPFATGYISRRDDGNWGGTFNRPLEDILVSLPFSPAHLLELFQSFISKRPWLIVPLALVIVAAGVVIVVLWRKQGWKPVALLIGAPMAYLLPMMMAWPFGEDVIRFSMPAIPFIIALCVYAAILGWDTLQQRRRAPSPAAT